MSETQKGLHSGEGWTPAGRHSSAICPVWKPPGYPSSCQDFILTCGMKCTSSGIRLVQIPSLALTACAHLPEPEVWHLQHNDSNIYIAGR